jgi:hypothetical protein
VTENKRFIRSVALLFAFTLLASVVLNNNSVKAALRNLGYSELPNGRGGTNVEALVFRSVSTKRGPWRLSKRLFIPYFGRTVPVAIARKTRPEVERRIRCTPMSM